MNNLEKKNKENKDIESTRGYYYETPECDIYETDKEYSIIFDIPGIEKEDINVKVEKDVLKLTAESKKQPLEDYECTLNEMNFNGYSRSFNLNGIVDTDKINADYNNGTLKLSLPKKEEKKTKEIKININ